VQYYIEKDGKIVKRRIKKKQVAHMGVYLDYLNSRGSVKRRVRSLKREWQRQEGKLKEEEEE